MTFGVALGALVLLVALIFGVAMWRRDQRSTDALVAHIRENQCLGTFEIPSKDQS